MTWAARLAALSRTKCLDVEIAEIAEKGSEGGFGNSGNFDIGRESQNEERETIEAEEAAPTLPAAAHAETVAALLLAASPLAGVLGARPCRSCQRGIWTSPSWRGPQPPDLCAECWGTENLAQRRRNEAQAIVNCERADREREASP